MTRRQIKERAARYTKYVEWSEEDGSFVGRCPELFVGAVHGADEAKVYAELCEAVEEWIELIEKDEAPLPAPLSERRKFSGKFIIRLDPALHRRLAAKALAAGESLNSFCAKTLVQREGKRI
jgi:predicted HicB family RNase H-like nuclease